MSTKRLPTDDAFLVKEASYDRTPTLRAIGKVFLLLLVVGLLVGLLTHPSPRAGTADRVDRTLPTMTPLPVAFENQSANLGAYLRLVLTRWDPEEAASLRQVLHDGQDTFTVEFEEFAPLADTGGHGRPHEQVAHILQAMHDYQGSFKTLIIVGVDDRTRAPNLRLVFTDQTVRGASWLGTNEHRIAQAAATADVPWWWAK